MPYVKYKTDGLKSIKDIAEMIGLSAAKTWKLVADGTIENPTTPAGRRVFYDPIQTERIIKQVSRLRKSGIV
jgi:hypothetical protein